MGWGGGWRREAMQALYLVIFQMQQSSAKIKFIGFSMDIAVHSPPHAVVLGRGGVREEWKEKTANATCSRT